MRTRKKKDSASDARTIVGDENEIEGTVSLYLTYSEELSGATECTSNKCDLKAKFQCRVRKDGWCTGHLERHWACGMLPDGPGRAKDGRNRR